jgi:hypothetical protein
MCGVKHLLGPKSSSTASRPRVYNFFVVSLNLVVHTVQTIPDLQKSYVTQLLC